MFMVLVVNFPIHYQRIYFEKNNYIIIIHMILVIINDIHPHYLVNFSLIIS